MIVSKYTFKVVVVGEGGVGKTSMLNRYVEGTFDPDCKITIGVDIKVKHVRSEDDIAVYQIWDFGGQIRFRVFQQSYFKGAKAVFFVYDPTSFVTLERLLHWKELHRASGNYKDSVKFYIGTKKDLIDEGAPGISKETLKDYVNNNHYRISSKTGENIDQVFQDLTKILIEKSKTKRDLT
jgi:small GTP-binding protein